MESEQVEKISSDDVRESDQSKESATTSQSESRESDETQTESESQSDLPEDSSQDTHSERTSSEDRSDKNEELKDGLEGLSKNILACVVPYLGYLTNKWETGNFGCKIKWFRSFGLGSFRKYGLCLLVMAFEYPFQSFQLIWIYL